MTRSLLSLTLALTLVGCESGAPEPGPVEGAPAGREAGSPALAAPSVDQVTAPTLAASADDPGSSAAAAVGDPASSAAPAASAAVMPEIEAAAEGAVDDAGAPAQGVAGHGHVAPVDCPLAAAGHDPTKMKPFEQVAEYIAFLERPDRATWQRPDAVVEALGLAPDAIVADLGAGSGYFAFRFAAAVPEGRVDAMDVEPEMIRHMHHKAMVAGIENLHAEFVDADAPNVAADVDLVFVCDVLHHVADRPAWLAAVTGSMAPDAKLALVEFEAGDDIPEGPPPGLAIPRADLIDLAEGAGLTLVDEHSELLPYQVFLVFERAE